MKILKITVILMLVASMLVLAACNTVGNNTGTTEPEITTEDPTVTTEEPVVTTEEAPVTTDAPDESKDPVLDKSKTYNILFVGNSYTYYNSMPETHFSMIMRDAGYDIEVTSLTKGSQKLAASADPSDELGAKIDRALKEEKFDFVILQEAGSQSIKKPAAFLSATRILVEKIRANGATPILYSVWGSKEGRESLSEYGGTTESMMWMIAASNEKVGAELGIEVANVGMAFYDVHKDYSKNKINLYHTDLYHPSDNGSYLAALTIFAEITGVDPMTITYNAALTAAKADILQAAAREAVFEAPKIPEEYK